MTQKTTDMIPCPGAPIGHILQTLGPTLGILNILLVPPVVVGSRGLGGTVWLPSKPEPKSEPLDAKATLVTRTTLLANQVVRMLESLSLW